MNTTKFQNRHIALNEDDKQAMLARIGVPSLDELINQTIPEKIRSEKDLDISEPLSESELLAHSKALASKNQIFDTYIGFGYHEAILPAAIQRNIFENPSWYTCLLYTSDAADE